jgi:lipopolysaccharide export LptBFGC system permease protein LptF
VNLLDRYIARQFITNTALLLLLLGSFVVMVDVSLNISRFAEVAGQMVQNSGSGGGGLRKGLITFLLIADLWWPRLLQLFNFVAGLVLVGAMGFTFSQLVRQRELVAVLAGGISLYRAARPVVLVAAGVLALQVVNQELVMPRIAHLLTRDAADAGRREASAFPVKLTRDGDGRLWQAFSFDPSAGTLDRPHIWERDPQGRVTRRFAADRAVYQHPGRWRLENPRLDTALTAPDPRPRARTNSASAAPPLEITTDITPTTLLADQFAAFSQSLSWRQMFTVLAADNLRPEVRERLQRLAWGRASALASSFLALLIALPFFLSREPVNMVAQSLKCAPLAIGSVVLGVVGSAAVIPGLPPAVSAMVPIVILLPLAIAAVTSIRT